MVHPCSVTPFVPSGSGGALVRARSRDEQRDAQLAKGWHTGISPRHTATAAAAAGEQPGVRARGCDCRCCCVRCVLLPSHPSYVVSMLHRKDLFVGMYVAVQTVVVLPAVQSSVAPQQWAERC